MAVKWILYLHTIPKEITGYDHDKYYVGITSRKPIDRWGSKGQYYRGVFKNAIDKYGWDNIRHEILFTDLTEEQAQNLEIAHIQILKSNIKKYGYNRTDGGAGGNTKPTTPVDLYDLEGHYMMSFFSASECARYIGVNRGSVTYVCQRKGKSVNGYIVTFKGEKPDLSVRKNQKAVYQYDIEGNFLAEYKSVDFAHKITGISAQMISTCANKKCMLASGYQWSYEKLDNIGKYSPIKDSHNIYRKEKNGNIK